MSDFQRTYIMDEIDRRKKVNPRYSIRAFARSAHVDPGNLSRVLGGSAAFSRSTLEKVADELRLEGRARNEFLGRKPQTTDESEISPAVCKSIVEFYHLAILELTFFEDFEATPSWVSEKVGISEGYAKIILMTLEQTGMLVEQDGRMVKATDQVLWSLREGGDEGKQHDDCFKEILARSSEAIDEREPEEVARAAIVFPSCPKRMTLAKKLIQEFAGTLCRALATKPFTEVYQLGICMFPITSKEGSKR